MKSNFDYFFTELLKDEGGYSNNPSDPGGPTNLGVTLNDYRAYINPNGTASDVKKLTIPQAKIIYKKQYWDKLNCDSLPSGVDYCVADYGVNSGTARAARIYARLHSGTPTDQINAICDERVKFLKGLRTYPVFGKGWMNRMAHVRKVSLALAKSPATPTTSPAAVHAGIVGAMVASVGAAYHWAGDHKALIIAVTIFAGLMAASLYSAYKAKNDD